MQIHTLKVQKNKKKKRVGRGGNYATYCRRGRDGQRSRSGGKSEIKVKVGRKGGYYKSMPMLGGFKSRNAAAEVVNLSELVNHLDNLKGKVISVKFLKKEGLLSEKAGKNVKVVGDKKSTTSPEKIKAQYAFSKDIKVSESVKGYFGLDIKSKKNK